MIVERTEGPGESLTGLVDEVEWQNIAASAGSVGRFVVDLATNICEIDATLRRLTGQLELIAPFPVPIFLDGIHADDRPTVEAALERMGPDGAPYEVEFRYIRANGEEIWLAGQGRRMSTATGRDLLIGVNYDITELHRARERSDMLAREMAHRMRNVFAVVQGMFNMAARTAPDTQTLADSFAGRLSALAAVNSLTFAGDDRSVGLDDLVQAVLGPLIAAGRVQADLAPDYRLNGAAAQTLVLALNELMTNAVKHGALRDAEGSIEVSALIVGPDLAFRWVETTPHTISEPEGSTGFGMRVLKTMTTSTLSGRPDFDWRPDGLHFQCHWNADAFGAVNEAAFDA